MYNLADLVYCIWYLANKSYNETKCVSLLFSSFSGFLCLVGQLLSCEDEVCREAAQGSVVDETAPRVHVHLQSRSQ